jgi:hypothetical protein
MHPDRSIAAAFQAAADRSACTGQTVVQSRKNIFSFTLHDNLPG